MKSAIFLLVASILLCSALRMGSDSDLLTPIEGTDFKFHSLEEDVHITVDNMMSVKDSVLTKEPEGVKIKDCKFGKADLNPLRNDEQ